MHLDKSIAELIIKLAEHNKAFATSLSKYYDVKLVVLGNLLG